MNKIIFTVDAVTGYFSFFVFRENLFSIQHVFDASAFTYVLRMHRKKKLFPPKILNDSFQRGFSTVRQHSTHLKYKYHCVIVANDMGERKKPLVPTIFSKPTNRPSLSAKCSRHTLLQRLVFHFFFEQLQLPHIKLPPSPPLPPPPFLLWPLSTFTRFICGYYQKQHHVSPLPCCIQIK